MAYQCVYNFKTNINVMVSVTCKQNCKKGCFLNAETNIPLFRYLPTQECNNMHI